MKTSTRTIPKAEFVADLQAKGNMMIHDGHTSINAIVDWNFWGQLVPERAGGWHGIKLFELEYENLLEYGQWSDRTRDSIAEKTRFRGQDVAKLELLVGKGIESFSLPVGKYSPCFNLMMKSLTMEIS